MEYLVWAQLEVHPCDQMLLPRLELGDVILKCSDQWTSIDACWNAYGFRQLDHTGCVGFDLDRATRGSRCPNWLLRPGDKDLPYQNV